MTLNLHKSITILLFPFCIAIASAQQKALLLPAENNTGKFIAAIAGDKAINADSAVKLLAKFSDYPAIPQTGVDYMYYYNDSLYGKIPLRVFIPATYKNTEKSKCILLLHGAVGGSKFADIDTLEKFDDNIFALLKKENYVIVRPVADPSKKFDWVVNRFRQTENRANLTYKTLTDIMISLKRIINIDDNKVFAFGHSDGSDGAIGLGVYSPNLFAGVMAYNSMLNNIFAYDFYIRNIINTPLYIVHSDLDDLRPIQQTRLIINALKPMDNNLLYKEYIGYKHYDKHLDKDIPYSSNFINSTSRNPYKKSIYWENAGYNLYNSCNWIKITEINGTAPTAAWDTAFNFKTYNKLLKQYENRFNYYSGIVKGAVIRSSYFNNTFTVETSKVAGVELLISPVMVNLEEPVNVIINGKTAFTGKVVADKNYIIKNFKSNFDRETLWVNSIKIKVN